MCIEPFQFEVDEDFSVVVVDGDFTTAEDTHSLRISTTLNYGKKFLEPLSGAKVTLFNGLGDQEQYVEKSRGEYLMYGNLIQGVTDEMYYIEIELPGEKMIRSKPGIMPPKVKVDSVVYKFEQENVESRTGILFYKDVISVYVHSKIPKVANDSEIYLRWETDELYLFGEIPCGPLHAPKTCYVPISGNRQEIALIKSEDYSSEALFNKKIYTKTDLPLHEFYSRHYFNAYQRSISSEAYKYWEQIQILVNQSGTIFDLPPSPVYGNLYYAEDNKPVLGYFELAAIDTAHTFVYPSEYKENINLIPYCSRLNRTVFAECCSCLILENAHLERPDYVN